jgi:bacterioferritin
VLTFFHSERLDPPSEFTAEECDGATVSLAACREVWSNAMRGDEKVIDYLNRALKHELTAVNQYWLHYRMLDNWGYKELAKTWRKESIEEMQHADQLVARILFLDGLPNMQSLDALRIGQNVKEILECDLAAEMHARALYLEAAGHCEKANDRVSRILFEKLTSDEEEHIDFLEAQLTLVEQLGLQLYSQKHVGELEGD